MNTNKKTAGMEDKKSILSTLWIFVMVNMVFADIFSFMVPGLLQGIMTGYAEKIPITQGFLLGAAMVTEIPIVMIVLSRVLKDRANRWVNTIAAAITILYVIGGGSTTLHYIFIAGLEVGCALIIIWLSWKWKPAIEATVRKNEI